MIHVNKYISIDNALAAQDALSPNVAFVAGATNIDHLVYTDIGKNKKIQFKQNAGFVYGEEMSSGPAANEIWYTTTDGQSIEISMAGISSNVYASGKGIITFEENVTQITDDAFSACPTLKTVALPEGLTYIGNNAFYDCSQLTTINMPSTVTSLGILPFEGCTCLPVVNHVFYAGDVAVGVDDKGYSTYTLKDNTRLIASAFVSCLSLTSLTFPSSLERICAGSFFGCSSLESITLPDSVKSIGEEAFYECAALTSVNLGNSLQQIDFQVFGCCTALSSLTFPASMTSIGASPFTSCSLALTCLATTPPELQAALIEGVTAIYVPSQSVDAYKAADNWSDTAVLIQAIP